jgi:predicted dehydrogenase
MFSWGIIGGGFVAHKFAHALNAVPGARIAVVYSRSEATAQGFAARFGNIPWTTDLAEALATPQVDACYIATPPTSHREQALAALGAGKPVLIEKPLAASAADARAIAEAARAAGVFAMEGIWTRFVPAMATLRALLAERKIGTPLSFEGSFGNPNVPSLADNQFNPALGGGALLHRGLYPISIALDLLGPAELAGSAAIIGETGVDEEAVVTLRHHSGALSVARASLRASLPNACSLAGTHGQIAIAPPIFRPFQMRLVPAAPAVRGSAAPRFASLRESGAAQAASRALARLRPPGRLITRPFAGNGYGHEAIAVMEAIRRGETEHPLMPLAHSVALAQLLEAARARADAAAAAPAGGQP